MRDFKTADIFGNKLSSPILKHGLIGILVGYLILHPISMGIYYFEHHRHDGFFLHFIHDAIQQIFMSFRLNMLPMAFFFSIIGACMGVFYGYHIKTILAKNSTLTESERKLKNQILLSDKQATLGIIASSIGHEINNFLTSITGYSQLLQIDKNVSDKFDNDLQKIIKSSSDVKKLSNALLALGKPAPSVKKHVDLCAILDDVTDTLIFCGVLKRIQITRRYLKGNINVVCDPFMLEQVIRNIEINASHAMNGQGELILETGVYQDSNSAYLKIKDSGTGIPNEHLQNIFEPFFTTKEESKGTGLGLSIVKQIVEDLGGEISVRNRKESGAEFEIALPVADWYWSN